MAEHERIARYFAPLATAEPGSFHLSDDAAALDVPKGQKLVVTTDSVIEGTHLPMGATPQQMAVKLMRRNLSDLAAMGAKPWRYLLNLHTPPKLNDRWFAEFADTLRAEQKQFGMVLIGGDSTTGEGPIRATLTCFGLTKKPLLRRGIKPGDLLYVSGTVGDAALCLALEQWNDPFLSQRYYAPEPRLALGQALVGIASAAIDVSDGIGAEAKSLARTNKVGIDIWLDRLPLSDAAKRLSDRADFWSIIGRGDDYELCFAVPPTAEKKIEDLSKKLKLPLTRIGTVTRGKDFQVLDANAKPVPLPGYEHA